MEDPSTGVRDMPRSTPILDVRDLRTEFTTRFGVIEAVAGVDLTVTAGAFVGVVGESGSGKSALVRSILGLLPSAGRVTGGDVRLQGRALLNMKKRQLRALRGREIGFVSQNPFSALNPVMRIGRQFHNVLKAHGLAENFDKSLHVTVDALAAAGIPRPAHVAGSYAGSLSGGMAQRVVIALALLLAPKLLIADEPTTALDLIVQRQILDLIKAKGTESGMAVLLVTHDLGVIAEYFDHVVVMSRGKVVESGPVASTFVEPRHPYTQTLIESVPKLPAMLDRRSEA